MKRIITTLSKKWPEYFLEIFVLIIGIYGAFALENWKETRKEYKAELEILRNIKEDILLDTIDLRFNLDHHMKFLKEEQKFLAFLNSTELSPPEPIVFADVLGTPLLVAIHETSFDNLKNNDLSVMRNSRLKKNILRFYDFFTKALTMLENEYEPYVSKYNQKLSFFQKHFKLKDGYVDLRAPDSEYNFTHDFKRHEYDIRNLSALRADDGFKILIAEDIFMRQVRVQFYLDIMERIRELNEKIDEELTK